VTHKQTKAPSKHNAINWAKLHCQQPTINLQNKADFKVKDQDEKNSEHKIECTKQEIKVDI